MTRTVVVHFVVEGQTEQEFIQSVLWPDFRFSLSRLVSGPGQPQYHAKVACLGGGLQFERLMQSLQRLLRCRGRPVVTTMLDLYGLPRCFPLGSKQQSMRGVQRAEAIESEMARHLNGEPRFVPYIQVHEFETLLFAEPDRLMNALRLMNGLKVTERALRDLKNDVGNRKAEDINDGYDTAPSRRIKRFIPAYDKAAHGPPIANEIGLNTIRESCPHFNGWLERLQRAVSQTLGAA